jgi:hypothetical protein
MAAACGGPKQAPIAGSNDIQPTYRRWVIQPKFATTVSLPYRRGKQRLAPPAVSNGGELSSFKIFGFQHLFLKNYEKKCLKNQSDWFGAKFASQI